MPSVGSAEFVVDYATPALGCNICGSVTKRRKTSQNGHKPPLCCCRAAPGPRKLQPEGKTLQLMCQGTLGQLVAPREPLVGAGERQQLK